MQSPARPPPSGGASAAAARFLAANLGALGTTQPLLAAIAAGVPDVRPVYARDGSLTVFGLDGRWWHDCSVPLAAAEVMLATLDVKGRVACLLMPTSAAPVRVALRRSRADQAVIAICPDRGDLGVLLRCDDFSREIRSHRLWFAWGPDWQAELRRLFHERPGLATPAQFIRLPTTPAEEIDRVVSAAQPVFTDINAARCTHVANWRDQWRRPTVSRPRLCVIAPAVFRLWNDAGAVLADALVTGNEPTAAADVVRFDPDDPASSSTLALLDAADGCTAVVAADLCRADLAGVVPAALPWVTWVTRPSALPAFAPATAEDALVLADPAWRTAAAAAGWPSHRVTVGDWPGRHGDGVRPAPPAPVLAVIADTRPVVPPELLEEFSSHKLLWNHIATELAGDPFVLAGEPGPYLHHRMGHYGIGADGFDVAPFFERLIVPAYEQAVVRLLIRWGLPVRLYGEGWGEFPEFREIAAGPVVSGTDLVRIHDRSTAVVDVSPVYHGQPVRRLGRPVVQAMGRTSRQFLVEAGRALAGMVPRAHDGDPISLGAVLDLLGNRAHDRL